MERSRFAATLAWLAPTAAVATVGVLDGLDLSAKSMIGVVASGVVVGTAAGLVALAIGPRRRAAPGLITCFVVVVGAGIAFLSGVGNDRHRADVRARLQQQGNVAATAYPGWYGVAADHGVRIFALQLDLHSDLARTIADNFDRPVSLLVFGVDNRAGSRDVEIDLTEIHLMMRDGTTHTAPPRAEILKSAHRDELRTLHVGVYGIPHGTVRQNALAFLAPSEPMETLAAVSILLDGRSFTIPGRYYTAEEKRARAAHH
jgi:hypothetical protein